jgi:hypothetical protein
MGFLICLLFATAEIKANFKPSLREKIIAALSAEIPNARAYFNTNRFASHINESLLLDNSVVTAAEGVVSHTICRELEDIVCAIGSVLVITSRAPAAMSTERE